LCATHLADGPVRGRFFVLVKIIIVATRNVHKAAEIAAMLKSFQIRSLKDFPSAPEVVEDAGTFEGNATKKAVSLANWLAKTAQLGDGWVLADDSGLEVDALNGAPGVHSARFAAIDPGASGNSPDSDNNAKLLRLLGKHPRPWTARFRCVLAFTPIPFQTSENSTCLANEAELATRIFSGACEGQIIPDAKGAHGFGYDPHFVPNGHSETFAELGNEIKNRISHRAEAMRKLQAVLAQLF
jgi:XTP/dITP diphosphohydrolase